MPKPPPQHRNPRFHSLSFSSPFTRTQRPDQRQSPGLDCRGDDGDTYLLAANPKPSAADPWRPPLRGASSYRSPRRTGRPSSGSPHRRPGWTIRSSWARSWAQRSRRPRSSCRRGGGGRPRRGTGRRGPRWSCRRRGTRRPPRVRRTRGRSSASSASTGATSSCAIGGAAYLPSCRLLLANFALILSLSVGGAPRSTIRRASSATSPSSMRGPSGIAVSSSNALLILCPAVMRGQQPTVLYFS
jgi:hypothetical protein